MSHTHAIRNSEAFDGLAKCRSAHVASALAAALLAIAFPLSGVAQAAEVAAGGAAPGGAAPSAGQVAEGKPIVAEVTMVIGVARIVGAEGLARKVERSGQIRVGDKIETDAGGHVHLRFVDGGRLSIRPASRLTIENYQYGPSDSTLSAIKFRLDEGVVRSITGAWGEAARERFRLNTPVAAIGVKGTDFVVKSDSENTAASVYLGAIIVSPLVPGCASSVGPCQSGAERLLSHDMKGQMLQLSRAQTAPQLVPAVDLLAQNIHRSSHQSGGDTAVSAIEKPQRPESGVVYASAVQTIAGESRAVSVTEGNNGQLSWGRWSAAPFIEGDQVSRIAADAAKGGTREGTLGNGIYGLYRTTPGSGAVFAPAETSASFRLNASAAQLNLDNARAESVRIDNATLNVDFARATFATQIGLSSPTLGRDSLDVSGRVQSNGYLLPSAGNGYAAGALSLDAREAGLFFEKSVPAGYLRGITLWGR